MRPALTRLWTAFPDHNRYPTLRDLYTMIGGVVAQNIDAPGFGANGNTCASRLSHAFNHGGAPIDPAIAKAVGAKTISAANKQQIIFKVADFRAYLVRALGRPTSDNASPYDDAFRSMRGIIAFGVEGWGDATGHIALINHGSYREPGHDDYASFVRGKARTVRGEFWELS